MASNTTPVPYAGTFESKKNSIHNIDGPAFMVVEQKGVVTKTTFDGTEKPEVPFSGCFFLANHDPRLTLSDDTYVQLTMAAGLRIKVKQPVVNKATQKWMKKIKLERKIEDGLHSYYQCGNMMFEFEDHMAAIEEIDLSTMQHALRKNNKPDILAYVSRADSMSDPVIFKPEEVVHFKYTNTRKEVWGRGLFHSIIASRNVDGEDSSPLLDQWKMEASMVKIFEGYASPIMMINFKDAGEEWIKQKEVDFKKMKAGAKIITDKEFEAKVFEVNGAAKFDGYVDHRQTNLVEPGVQFPLAFFNGGFQNQKAEEITDSVLGRKIKRIQKRVAAQIKDEIVMPYVKFINKAVTEDDVQVFFEIESKSELGNVEVIQLFEKGGLTRSELRRHVLKKTTVELDEDDMEDTPPINPSTSTNDLLTSQPSAASQGMDPNDQQAALMALQAQMGKMEKLIENKIPKPRGRPKKNEMIATRPDIRTLDDLKSQINQLYPGMAPAEIEQLITLMKPIFFNEVEIEANN